MISLHYPSLVHFELCNWSRYCWEGSYPHPLPSMHCASFEHHYLAPSDMGNDEEAKPRIVANARRALVVQKVFDGLPLIPRLVLRAEYPQRNQSGRYDHGMIGAARKLRIRLSEYESALSYSIRKVMEAFE